MSNQVKFVISGNTPLVKLDNIYFKCEYENPTESHKDRAFSYQISKLKKQGIKKAVLSSSGNAAISAAHYCQLADIELTVFISPNINKNKLQVLKKLNCKIFQTPKPVSSSMIFAGENDAYNLRQSTDPNALVGYESIASEIINEGILPDAVFIPVSSGTVLIGISLGFKKLNLKVPIHAVQTDAVHPVAGVFDKDFKLTDQRSLADAIVAKYTPLQDKVISNIQDTCGWGWVINNEEMKQGRNWLLTHDLDCSYEGGAVLAALWKSKKQGHKFKYPVCLLTGKFY